MNSGDNSSPTPRGFKGNTSGTSPNLRQSSNERHSRKTPGHSTISSANSSGKFSVRNMIREGIESNREPLELMICPSHEG